MNEIDSDCDAEIETIFCDDSNYLEVCKRVFINKDIGCTAIYCLMHEFRVKGRENDVTVWVDSKTNEHTDIVVLMGENKEPIKQEIMLECKELLDKIVKEKCIIDEYKHIGTRFKKLYILAEKDANNI